MATKIATLIEHSSVKSLLRLFKTNLKTTTLKLQEVMFKNLKELVIG